MAIVESADEVHTDAARLKRRVEDLEERVRALTVTEFKLRKSEARFRALAEINAQMIWVTQASTGSISLSPAWRAFTGQTEEEIHNGGWLEALHPEDRERISELWKAHMASGQACSAEHRLRRHDGVYCDFLLQAAPVRDEEGTIHEWVGTYIDITERKQMERALRESEERLRLLATHLPVGVFQCDMEGNCLFVNECWSAITGMPQKEALGKGWLGIIHPEDVAGIYSKPTPADGTFIAEYRAVRPTGEILWVNSKAVPLRDKSGTPTGYIGSVLDVTLAKQTEDLLRQTMEQKAVIEAQQAALAEVSVPLIPINHEIMVMPLIGAIDTKRAARVMDALLTGISRNRARVAVLDITGVTTIDAQTADALVGAAKAVRLLGAQIVLSGIRAEVAQTLVNLGVELHGIVTCGTLQSAIAYAMRGCKGTL